MQPDREIVSVDGRFCGPPDIGNGGYVAGLMAERIGAAAQVTLRRPTPLDRPLALRRHAEGHAPRWTLEDGDTLLAEAVPAQPDASVPEAPTPVEAALGAAAAAGWVHPFPRCFVCGPERAPGDGLGVLPGRYGAGDAVAAPWVPAADLADAAGRVAPRFVWAALDCPGAIAAMGDDPSPMVLGRITGETFGRVRAGEPCVVTGWQIARDGRKHTAGTALFGSDKTLLGVTLQVWIRL